MTDTEIWLDDFHTSWSKPEQLAINVVFSERETKALLGYLQDELDVHKAAKVITFGIEREEGIEYGVSRS